jgi:hypothetical protein
MKSEPGMTKELLTKSKVKHTRQRILVLVGRAS